MAKNNGKVMEAIVKVCGSIDPSLGQAVSDTESKLGKINVKAAAITTAIGAGIAGTAKLTIEAGKYLADLGTEYQQALNSVSASTGAQGEELAQLGETVKDVYAANFGESFDDVGQAVSEVQKQTGLIGDDLTKATEGAFALSDTFDYEIGETSKAASAMVKNLGTDAEHAYDLIAYGAQNGADRSGDLLDSINEYAVQYQSLGLSADEMIQGFVTAGEDGVFMIDKVGDAVKEFNIRSKDGSDSSTEGFEILGMNAQKMFNTFAAGGEGANEAFYEVVNALDAMDDPVKKNQAAVDLFGTQYEDLEKNILPILSSMQDAELDNIDTLSQINSVKYDDINSAMEGIKRQAEVSLLPLANLVANSVNSLMPIIGDTIENLSPLITDLVADITPVVNSVLPEITSALTELSPAFGDIISSILPQFVDIIAQLLPFITQIITQILPVIVDLLNMIMPILSQAITLILPIIMQLIQTLIPIIIELVDGPLGQLLNALLTLMTNAASPLVGVIQILAAMFTETLTGALGELMPVINSVINILTNLINFIMNVFTGNWSAAWQNVVNIFKNIFTAIGSYVKAPINAIITGINSFIAGVNKIKIPDWVPKVGGKSLNIAKIGYLAEGGFTNGPSIAGEVPGQTEAVISFLPSVRDENIALWQKAGEMLGIDTQQQTTPLQLAGELINLDNFSLGDMGGTTIIYYDFSGFEYHPEIHNEGNSSEDKNIIDELEENKYEFADWFENWISLVTQED